VKLLEQSRNLCAHRLDLGLEPGQPVLRAFRSQIPGAPVSDTREVKPGEVWEENEFWIELSWRMDPDGSLGIRKFYEFPNDLGLD
jgi:hypothetical protein